MSETAEKPLPSGEIEVDIIDIEEFSLKSESKKPKAKKYRIRVDKEKFVVEVPSMTGREILKLAGKNPAEWLLNQKIKKRFEPVDLDEVVDFTAPGVERFTTLPKEQTEGRPALRRAFPLPEEDTEALDASGVIWETVQDGNNRWVLIHAVPLPGVFLARETAVAIQVPASYPPAALDMVYYHPAIQRTDGQGIPCTEASVQIEGVNWQRWSRHYTSANPWRPGEFNIFTHYTLSQAWLQREVTRYAAK